MISLISGVGGTAAASATIVAIVLVTRCGPLDGAVGRLSVAAGKGIDLAADARALADAEAFFGYFKSIFVPLVEKVYSEVAADIK
jgi:hypothetical protein